jgi:hypothetical protein
MAPRATPRHVAWVLRPYPRGQPGPGPRARFRAAGGYLALHHVAWAVVHNSSDWSLLRSERSSKRLGWTRFRKVPHEGREGRSRREGPRGAAARPVPAAAMRWRHGDRGQTLRGASRLCLPSRPSRGNLPTCAHCRPCDMVRRATSRHVAWVLRPYSRGSKGVVAVRQRAGRVTEFIVRSYPGRIFAPTVSARPSVRYRLACAFRDDRNMPAYGGEHAALQLRYELP